ncbi:MAG TPA: hemerythrin domain-containing protein [Bacteroidota bacterium]|nr:hemerythrin domain-containing protein [Bacteroidota bacterium]
MKRHPAFIALSQEHHDGLLLATRLQQGTNALLRLWSHDLYWQAEFVVKFFDENLRQHFSVEEEIVFFGAGQYLPEHSGMIQKLIDQHNTMRSITESLRFPLEEKLQTLLIQFGKILEQHIRTEEREFFPLCEAHIPEEQIRAMGKRIDELLK